MKCLCGFLVLAVLLAFCAPGFAQETPPESAATTRIELHEVDAQYYPIIRAYFSAFDAQAGRVLLPSADEVTATLGEGAVSLSSLEDISDTDRPAHLMFVFDLTRSVTEGTDYLAVQRNLARTIMGGLDSNDLVGAVSFDGQAAVVQQSLDDHARFQSGVLDALEVGEGQANAFLDGLYLALETLNQRDATGGRRMVVVFTDVEDPLGDHTRDEIVQLANGMQTPIFLIGFGDDVNELALRDFSASTSGITFLEEEPGAGDLERAATDLAGLVGTEWLATFRSTAPSNGGESAQFTLLFRDGQAQQTIVKTARTLHVSFPLISNGHIVSDTVWLEPQILYDVSEAGEPEIQSIAYFVQGERYPTSSGQRILLWDTDDLAGGVYEVRVQVDDVLGNRGSTVLQLQIVRPVSVEITSPVHSGDGEEYPAFGAGVVAIEADILSIVNVREAVLSVDGVTVGGPVRTTPNYLFEWNATDFGSLTGAAHLIEVKAVDVNGEEAFDTVTVYILPASQAPMDLTIPVGGAGLAVLIVLILALRRKRRARRVRTATSAFSAPTRAQPSGSAERGDRPATAPVSADDRSHRRLESAQAFLIGIQPRSVAGRHYQLHAPMSAIGRSKRDNQLQFDDQTISRHHAQILERNGKFFYVDLNSPNYNPSQINGRVVQGEVLLRNGDRVKLGSTVFEFRQS